MSPRVRLRLPQVRLVCAMALGLAIVATPAAADPGNDNFADAFDHGVPGVTTTDTAGATTEAGEPSPSCGDASATVWYRVTITSGRRVEFRTFGSKFDTVLAVYKGSGLGDLTEVACNDDATDVGSQQSRLSVALVANTAYFVQVAGFGSASGPMKLTSELLLNDNFADAIEIAEVPSTQEIDTDNATLESGEPRPCAPIEATVWYRLTLPAAMRVTINSFGSNFDTVLAAYTGTDYSNLHTVACNDQYEEDLFLDQSAITFNAAAGVTYHIQAGGYFGSVGHLVLNLLEAPPPPEPPNNAFVNAVEVTETPFADEIDTIGATFEPGEPSPSCAPASATVWYRFTPVVDRTLIVETVTSEFDTVVAVYQGDSLDSLSEVLLGCNDDIVPTQVTESAVAVRLTGGVTYYIQAGGFEGDTGLLRIFLKP